MKNLSTLELAYKTYLKYLENKELKKIKVYMVERNEETLSLSEKILIYKLYHLQNGIEKISFSKFLDGDLHSFSQAFESYFTSLGYNNELKSAIGKIQKLKKNKDDSDFVFQDYIKEALRKDKIEERLKKILWHVVPSKNSIQNILTGERKENKSLFMKSTETPDEKELQTFLNSSGEYIIYPYTIQLTKKFKSMKIDIRKIEREHAELQKELSRYYDLVPLYYFK